MMRRTSAPEPRRCGVTEEFLRIDSADEAEVVAEFTLESDRFPYLESPSACMGWRALTTPASIEIGDNAVNRPAFECSAYLQPIRGAPDR